MASPSETKHTTKMDQDVKNDKEMNDFKRSDMQYAHVTRLCTNKEADKSSVYVHINAQKSDIPKEVLSAVD